MALFLGTANNDIITPATISAGVSRFPPGSNLSGDDAIATFGGNDTVEPDSGDDLAALGAGNDRFIWNPGDGDDIVFGEAGTDTLEFNGSDQNEVMTVTTQAGGFEFSAMLVRSRSMRSESSGSRLTDWVAVTPFPARARRTLMWSSCLVAVPVSTF
jgi:Ca2+-binding RTX toxin-like protein